MAENENVSSSVNYVIVNTIQTDLSFGEKLVGIDFNPAGNPKVQKAKELCAELADLLFNEMNPEPTNIGESVSSTLRIQLYEKAIGDILDAQMNAVKVLTFKY